MGTPLLELAPGKELEAVADELAGAPLPLLPSVLASGLVLLGVVGFTVEVDRALELVLGLYRETDSS
ncbi:MAG: hypothetical protein OK454_07305 [Thaumarchaeota archaeon]|nr:hypothetical protein [Nitrososphaerota archaeon]